MVWQDDEMETSDIGDKRLNERQKLILERLSKSSQSSFSQCFKSRAELKAAYRFFDNDFVTPEKILSPHYESTLARIKAQPTVILPNDTSSIDFSSKTSVEGYRILIIEDKKEERKLREKVRNAPIIGQTVFTMPTRSKKPERVVTQTLRACSVHLKGKKVGDREYPSIKINVVFTEEINSPPGEEPVSWLLFTTLPIETIEQVLKIIQYYLCRWDIEVFFKVLKSGCKVEDRELKSADSLTKIMALYMIVAWRVLYTMTMGRKQPPHSMHRVLRRGRVASGL